MILHAKTGFLLQTGEKSFEAEEWLPTTWDTVCRENISWTVGWNPGGSSRRSSSVGNGKISCGSTKVAAEAKSIIEIWLNYIMKSQLEKSCQRVQKMSKSVAPGLSGPSSVQLDMLTVALRGWSLNKPPTGALRLRDGAAPSNQCRSHADAAGRYSKGLIVGRIPDKAAAAGSIDHV